VVAGIGDCNMQGISGAVLSGVDIYLLDEILNKLKSNEWNPSIVLNSLNEKIQSTMGEAFVTDIQRDGLHMSMFMYNTETLKGYYSGAKRTMVVTRRGEVTEYFGDNLSLGKDNGDKEYNCINIQLFPDDTIYMYSDGCTDVVGGPYCKPLLTVNFKKEIQRKQVFTLAEQKIQFKKFFEDWIGDLEQTDDITMLAFKI
ncbi:MAG: serine/threonine-protein phosphatase, partial [Bacteroidales bacterium]|nr:serine/threonine-protein phosphatase [Bacteroidales bacterium]